MYGRIPASVATMRDPASSAVYERRPPMRELDDCVPFRLARLSRALYRPYKTRLERYHLTPTQMFLLLALYERDGLTAGELAERIHLDKSTLTGILSRLESDSHGLITRTGDENDGRSVRVVLTERGRKLRRPLTAMYRDVNARVLQALNAHEAALPALLAALEQAAEEV